MSDTPTRKEARAVHDVAALAQKLPGLDAARYFDFQADEEYRAALTRWPVLARLMKLAPCAPLSVHEGVGEVHEPARSL